MDSTLCQMVLHFAIAIGGHVVCGNWNSDRKLWNHGNSLLRYFIGGLVGRNGSLQYDFQKDRHQTDSAFSECPHAPFIMGTVEQFSNFTEQSNKSLDRVIGKA